MGPRDFSPELDIMIFRDAAHGMGHLCPRKSYSRFGAVSAGCSTDFESNSAGWIGYMPRDRTILSVVVAVVVAVVVVVVVVRGLARRTASEAREHSHTAPRRRYTPSQLIIAG